MQELKIINSETPGGIPIGGSVKGLGIDIRWQDVALGRGEDRKEPNGAFVDTVIGIAINRLEFYQDSKFECFENKLAIESLKSALHYLERRTDKREKKGIEGTHIVD